MSTKPIVLLTYIFPEEAMHKLQEASIDLRKWEGPEPMTAAQLKQFIEENAGASAILCTLNDKLGKSVLELPALSEVKTISTMSVGFDHIDIQCCKEREVVMVQLGITVGNTPGVLTDSTADLTATLILAAARRLPEAMDAVKSGKWGAWKPEWLLGLDLRQSTLGIVGFGRIGQAVATRMRAFGCNVVYHDITRSSSEIEAQHSARYVDSLEHLLKESDIVSVHCQLNKETFHLLNGKMFEHMKPQSILVNTSRGDVVDQDALAEALASSSHGPAIAALDVTSPEPLPTSHPLLVGPSAAKCIVVPHIGSATTRTRATMANIAVRNLLFALGLQSGDGTAFVC